MQLQLLLLCITLSVAEMDIDDEFYLKINTDDKNEGEEDLPQFDIGKIVRKLRENFTDCNQFLNNTETDVQKILNVNWQIFYYWKEKELISEKPVIIRFELPDPNLVQRYKSALSERPKYKMIDWNAAEMFMESNMDLSMILFRTNQSGLYEVAMSIEFDLEVKLEEGENRVALKFIEPYYLGLMNCDYRELLAMAPDDKQPDALEAESVAKKFNMKSDYGISYLEMLKVQKPDPGRPSYIKAEDDRTMDMSYEEPIEGELTIF